MAGVLPSPLSALGCLTPLTGMWLTAFFSQRYSNSDDSAARRCRTVAPLCMSSRRPRSSRQAMTCARVTVRDFFRPDDAGEALEKAQLPLIRTKGEQAKVV